MRYAVILRCTYDLIVFLHWAELLILYHITWLANIRGSRCLGSRALLQTLGLAAIAHLSCVQPAEQASDIGKKTTTQVLGRADSRFF